MKVYDCFSFYNEIELLEVRLHELCDVVDYFVLVEATKTHSGFVKPLYYYENKHLFRSFKDKIIHLIVNLPMTREEVDQSIVDSGDLSWIESPWQFEPNWARERHQRNRIMLGIESASPDDIIIIEDADEIVRASAISRLGNIGDNIFAVKQSLHTYYLNWKCNNMPWAGSKILKKKHITTPSEVRCHIEPTKFIKNGGWHFGFLGGIDAVKDKVKAYAHQEFNNQKCFDNIELRLSERKDGIGRLYQYDIVPIDDSYPKYILDNLYKFENWIYKCS